MDSKGVIVGCTKSYEWLLPWWHVNYSIHNAFPVTFFNLGDMTAKAQAWCHKRGTVKRLEFEEHFVKGKEKTPGELSLLWEKWRPNIWEIRKEWFKKPLALLQSPYQKTVWIDLDCQTFGPIDPLFDQYLQTFDVAMTAEPEQDQIFNRNRGMIKPNEIMYNSGVIAFKKGAKLIDGWGERSINENHLFYGDQQLFSRMILETKEPIEELPPIFNWPVARNVNPSVVILHYWGGYHSLISDQIKFLKQHWIMDLTALGR